jgi:single-strand DNA-binding protein
MPDGLNKVMLIGNLGKDPEMRYTANGTAMVNFTLAVNRSFTSESERKEETEWFRVVAWQKLAELVSQHLQKGRKVYVEGRLTTRSWDGQDGQKHYTTEVIANQVLFLDRPQGASFGEGAPADPSGDMDVDDIPFEG